MRFRLIKEYPGSPKLGTVVDIQNNDVFISDSCERLPITYVDIKKHPEVWQPEDEWMSKLTNSPKGSLHWLNTIGGRIAHIGEYMYDHPHDVSEQKCVDWGNTIETNIREVLDYFKDKLK